MPVAPNAGWKSFRLGCKLKRTLSHAEQGPWLTFVPAVPGTATRLGQRSSLRILRMRGAGSLSSHSLLVLLVTGKTKHTTEGTSGPLAAERCLPPWFV